MTRALFWLLSYANEWSIRLHFINAIILVCVCVCPCVIERKKRTEKKDWNHKGQPLNTPRPFVWRRYRYRSDWQCFGIGNGDMFSAIFEDWPKRACACAWNTTMCMQMYETRLRMCMQMSMERLCIIDRNMLLHCYFIHTFSNFSLFFYSLFLSLSISISPPPFFPFSIFAPFSFISFIQKIFPLLQFDKSNRS